MAGATIRCQIRGGGAQHLGRDRSQPDVARRTGGSWPTAPGSRLRGGDRAVGARAAFQRVILRRPPGEWRRARRRSGLAGKGKELLVPRLDAQVGGTSSWASDVYRRMRRTAASQGGCQFPADDKGNRRTTKARSARSLPLLTYSRLGGLRQGPGRAAELAAGPRADEDMGARRACLGPMGNAGDEPLVGLAVRLRALDAEVRVCAPPGWAERPTDSSERRQREMRTCPARGSTELEAPVIRSASAVQRSTAASKVSR